MLGVGADVYWQLDRDKYTSQSQIAPAIPDENPVKKSAAACADCGVDISSAVNDYSVKVFKKPLCRNCQSKYKR